MKKIKITVEGMSCEHCVQNVVNSLNQLKGVEEVVVDLAAQHVVCSYQENVLDQNQISEAIEEQGYDVGAIAVLED